MKVKVTENDVFITENSPVNQGDYGVNECEFQLPESFKGLNVTAVFSGIPVPVANGKCIIPSLKQGMQCSEFMHIGKTESKRSLCFLQSRLFFTLGKDLLPMILLKKRCFPRFLFLRNIAMRCFQKHMRL